MAATLYRRQRQVLQFIKDYLAEHQASPTLREIADHFKLSSLATVHAHLQRLEEKGYIRRNFHSERGIVVTDPTAGPLFREVVEIPLLGYATAGQPLEPAAKHAEAIVVPADLLGDREARALQIRGEGYNHSLLSDGDVVVIDQARSIEHGQIAAVVTPDGYLVIRRLWYETAPEQVKLEALIPLAEPIYVHRIEVLGRVLAVYRKY